jgi:hypothetical protein
MFPIDVLRFSEFRTMRNHLSDIQITSDYMSRWVVLKRRVGAVTSQRVLEVLFYVNILQCFFKIIMDAVEDYARRWIKREVDQDPKLRVLVKLCKNNQVSSTRSDSQTQKLC